MEHVEGLYPETSAVEAMKLSDSRFIAQILHDYPDNGKGNFSNLSTSPGEYWGISVALASAKLGMSIGFVKTENGIGLMADPEVGNYWLNFCGFEGRNFPGVREAELADTEPRSGLYTLLNQPDTSQLFEHVYALHTKSELLAIMLRDPMFEEVRVNQPASWMEVIDHGGVEQLYKEDSEKCLRLYLTRMLPRLTNLRQAITSMQRFNHLEEITDDMDESIRALIERVNAKTVETIDFNNARIEYWQTEYDFTIALLMEGYQPYNLSEIAPMVEEYLVSVLAFHPEHSPSDMRVEVPDIKDGLSRYLELAGLDLSDEIEDD